jgi:hypothetical protein
MEKFLWQSAAKLSMKPKSVGRGSWERRVVPAFIYGLLDLNVSHGLQLECATLRFSRIIPMQSTVDVAGMRVVPFNEV